MGKRLYGRSQMRGGGCIPFLRSSLGDRPRRNHLRRANDPTATAAAVLSVRAAALLGEAPSLRSTFMATGRILYVGQRLALAVAAVAIVTNGLTWLDLALTPVAIVCFLLVFPLFGTGLTWYLAKATPWAFGKPGWSRSQALAREMWNQILAGLSRPQLVVAYGFVAYVFINFFGTLAFTSAKDAEQMDPALQVRLMTGHAAIFLLIAAGLFRATRRFQKV